ncbi:MAG: DNA repair protein RecO [Planctomycetota bacterium]
MPRFKDQAICIRDLDWSETSQVVVLLTEQHGKLRGLAKGSRRQSPSSVQRFSGGIELLTAGQVIATTRPSSELAAITEWDLQDDYFPLRRDLRGQRVAMYAADVCSAMLADADPHPGAFGLLRTLLETLCRPGGALGAAWDAEVEAALLRFQWGLLGDLGYRPELERDVRSGGTLKSVPAYTFDPVAGGLTSERGIADWRVRRGTVDVLRAVASGDAELGADGAIPGRANRLLCVYVRALLDKQLPTMEVVLGTE